MGGDARNPSDARPLLRIDPATGIVRGTVYLGEVSHLAHIETGSLPRSAIAGSGLGAARSSDWRSGAVLDRHWYDGPVDEIVLRGNELWALEERPGTLLRLDPRTLAPVSAPLRLSPGRTLALASGGGFLWATAADTGEVLRIDPATRAIRRVHVGGSRSGSSSPARGIWFADHEGGKVVRLDPGSLRPVGEPIHVGAKPSWLAAAGGSLFVTDEEDGTVVRIDLQSGKRSVCRFLRPAGREHPRPLSGVGRTVRLGQQLCREHAHSHQPDRRPRRQWRRGDRAYRAHERRPEGRQRHEWRRGGHRRFHGFGRHLREGKVVVYRTVKLPLITLRYVTVGTKGTITFVVKIDTNAGTVPLDDRLRHEGVQGSSRRWHRARERRLHRQHVDRHRVALTAPRRHSGVSFEVG